MNVKEFLESLMVEEGINIDIKEDEPKKKKREVINDPAPEDPKPLEPIMVNTMDNTTNRNLVDSDEEELDEAPEDEEVPDEEAAGEEVPDEAVPEEPAGDEMGGEEGMGGDEMGADAGMGDMGGGMGGFGQEEDENAPENASEIGRMHELKKIHSRLSSLDMYLSSMLDPKLIRLKELVSKSRDLFHTVVSNFGMYKEQIDEIIVTYYKFLDEVFELLVKYYKSKKDTNQGG